MLTLDSGSRPIRSLVPAAALVVGSGCFAWTASHVWRFALDDTFITLRYARHLAAGLGAVHDPGEPAEGYPSPLWLLLLTLPTRLGLDPLPAITATRAVPPRAAPGRRRE